MKIGKKLGVGFGILCIFICIVGVVALNSINTINYQSDISKLVNDAIGSMNVVQTDVLRLIIYKDKKYYQGINHDVTEIAKSMAQAGRMMSSEKNRTLAGEIIKGAEEYKQHIDVFWGLDKSMAAAGKARSDCADTVITNLRNITDKYLPQFVSKVMQEKGGKLSTADLEKIFQVQKVRIIYNRVRVTARKYQLALDAGEQDTIAKEWLADIESTKSGLQKSIDFSADEAWVKAHNEALDALSNYSVLVDKFRTINLDRRKELAALKESAEKALELANNIQESVHSYVQSVSESILVFMIIVLVCAVLAGIVIAVVITRSIVKPARIVEAGLLELTAVTDGVANILKDKLAAGDWSQKVNAADNKVLVENFSKYSTKKDEMGAMCQASLAILTAVSSARDATNICIDKINFALSQVKATVAQLAGASSQVAAASQSLSQGATESAASLEEISSSMIEIGNRTNVNAENATQADSIAGNVTEAAMTGQSQMAEMTGAMSKISANAEETQKVVKTIDDIAFQTNLLALNAAVEAARAGQHGKGFAVVAEEVRNLAARSAKAAAETSELITNNNLEIHEGVKISEHTAQSLKLIAESVTKTKELVAEINAASSEQAGGISQINLGLEQIDAVTQQNTSNAEESAAAAEELKSQADVLLDLVGKFVLMEDEVQNSKRHKKLPRGGYSVVTPDMQIPLDDTELGKF